MAENVIRKPVYKHIENDLRDNIRRGNWPAGTMVPSRQSLAAKYKVSQATVERAIAGLISDGSLRASDRRGTFVNLSKETPERTPVKQDWPNPQTGTALLGLVASFETVAADRTDNLFYWPRTIMTALERSFLQPGDSALCCNIDRGPGKPYISLTSAIKQLKNQGATAIGVIDIHRVIEDSEYAEMNHVLASDPSPVICIASRELHVSIPQVYCDLDYAGFQAVQHLLSKGVQELFFTAVYEGDWMDERIRCAQAAVAFAGLPADTLQIVRSDELLPVKGLDGPAATLQGYKLGIEMASKGMLRGGVIAPNDFTAYGVMQAAEESGLCPGRDFLIIAIDDAPMSLVAGLTSLRPPLEDLGAEAGIVLQRMVKHQQISMQVRMRAQLMARSSTRDYRGVI